LISWTRWWYASLAEFSDALLRAVTILMGRNWVESCNSEGFWWWWLGCRKNCSHFLQHLVSCTTWLGYVFFTRFGKQFHAISKG
jgi:hypothetical protein